MKPVFPGNKYDRAEAELQQYLLGCILTAGQRATVAEQKCNDITADIPDGELPCNYLCKKRDLDAYLRSKRTGKYRYLANAIRRICRLDLSTATDEELRTIPGVGFKTSRMFMFRTRRNAPYVALDVHILNFLRDNGVLDVPAGTPASECEYLRLEAEALRMFSKKYPNLSPAEADAKVWESYSSKAPSLLLT